MTEPDLCIRTEKKEFPGEGEKIEVEYRLYRTSDGGYSVSLSTVCGGGCEYARADGITTVEGRAEEIFALLTDGNVTSCALTDILEDIL